MLVDDKYIRKLLSEIDGAVHEAYGGSADNDAIAPLIALGEATRKLGWALLDIVTRLSAGAGKEKSNED